ncbi:MAG: TraR/DksA C4-type zinc finger protein [Thermoanaerobacterales bacterium]
MDDGDRHDGEAAELDRVEADLAGVDVALERLDAGTYGRCEACGEPIADERLAADPTTPFCERHAQVAAALERDGAPRPPG